MARNRLLPVLLVLGLLFLYLPILVMVVYSFNDSRLVTSFTGFSVQWYRKLAGNASLIGAALLSLRIAALSACIATVIGTLAGVVMARLGPFRGRPIFAGLVAAPLVMPDIIIGISLLLLFVTLEQWTGWPADRGALTVAIAHATFASAYVAVIVQSRLADFDDSLEEAAMDLGARPAKVFFVITLPLIAPALLSGWLLAFTLSLDDLVVASFTSGPGATTLPMVVFSALKLGLTPELYALGTVIIAIVAAVLVAGALLQARTRRAGL